MYNYHTKIAEEVCSMEILIWQKRMERNLTLVQLAELTGISKSELNAIENGKVSPRIDTLEQIADGLGLTLFDLIQI